jgi:tetratricopeptide (TPR) repeat protein
VDADLAVAKTQGGECTPPLFFSLMEIEDKTTVIIDRAEQFLREGRHPEAIALYETIHKNHPEEESILLMLAWAHYDNGNTEKALSYLETILDRELKRKIFTGFAFDELVRVYKQERKFDKVVEICQRAVEVQPNDVGLLAELGNAYLNAKKSEEACRIFENLINLESDNPAFYCRWGEALFASGKLSESQAAYRRAAEIDPEEADRYHFQLANLFHNTGNNNEALKLLEVSITVNPSNSLYYCSLGDIFIALGRIVDAQAAYKTAIQYDNAGTGAYFNRLGHAFLKAMYFSQAIEAFKSAIEFDAAQPYYHGLASAYEAMGLIDVAHELLQKINHGDEPQSKL